MGQEKLNLSVFTDVDELNALGGSKLKNMLLISKLKNGGTIFERSERIWMTRGKNLNKFSRRIIQKKRKIDAEKKIILTKEKRLSNLSAIFHDILENTIAHIEMKSVKTYQEIISERTEEKKYSHSPDQKCDVLFLKNPLKLPMGPDDKPIPYWLYKLHGLNRKFECEICGNRVYEGRRAFEKHFQESYHQQGMHALSIDNTKIFFELTKIRDVVKLWHIVKSKQQGFVSVQEFEDFDGNVYDTETYTLLKKQGIV